jgi:hypothetical protein
MYSQPCTYCMHDPKSHSFYLLSTNNNIHIYNTIISNAELYYNPESIIYHITIALKMDKTYPNKDWVWIIDFNNASLKHYMALKTVKEISSWIHNEKQNMCKNLKQIKIINASIIIKPLLTLAKYYLPNHIEIICD